MKNHQGTKEDAIEKCLWEYLKRTTYLPGGAKHKKPSTATDSAPVEAVTNEEAVVNKETYAVEEGDVSDMEDWIAFLIWVILY